MSDSSPDGEAIPPSRRAAREAAARQAATGATPAQPPQSARPASPEPAPLDEGFPPVSSRAPRPTGRASTAEAAEDDPWIFAGAAVAPAMTYGRGTADGTASAPAARPTAPRVDQPNGGFAGGTLEDLFSGSTSTDDIGDVPPPVNRTRRRLAGWIVLGIVLAMLGGIAAGGLWAWNTYEDKIREVMGWEEPKDFEEGLATGEALVTIAAGDTGSPISQSLFDAGVTKTPDAFYDYLIDTAQNPNFQPGVYKLQKQMTSAAALAALLDPANKQEYTAAIPEGYTVEGTLERLAEGTGIPLEEFQAAIADPSVYGVPIDPAVVAAGGQPLEGWLFPATYTFDPGVTAQSAIQTLVDRTKQSLDAAGVPEGDRQRVLTIASIIQREVRVEDEMQKVSRVILNRLDPSNQETFGLLQMDSTAQYGAGEVGLAVSTSEAAQNDPNPWNTYVNAGLPVGPISNPGDVAINAAMNPADGPWLYFVTVNLNTGETIFTETYREHLRYVDQWQQWCADNPDAGC
ncbi:endolytic transglycosylase MltG [Microbacterium atlanticum]|uniref:endolytic transglycosylase MltG n=1 Tax=Microbacterium atlanticum TaxID=2782168 RepID=UPI001889BF1B|nr:endolytic transglycosylase MltG [Microbacterium atlanticum]